jgi:putative SOS response-associated peptidase YedK
MCTLYAQVAVQEALNKIFGVKKDSAGNLPAMKSIYPDGLAPVVRETAGGRELIKMRWGFPPPPNASGGRPVVNVRNTVSNFWKPWLKPEQRCLVPVTSFCEWTDSLPKTPVWFALSQERPPFAFAGIWRPWKGTRGTKKDPIEGEHLLYSFLTTDPNDDVQPIHSKAMPVILTTEDEMDAWMNAPIDDALELQRPREPGMLKIVARGEKSDGPMPTNQEC